MLPIAWSTPEFLSEAERVFARYPRRINALLPILQHAAAHAPLTFETVPHVARMCWTTADQALLVARAYGLLTDGTAIATLMFCVNIHCQQRGAEELRLACRAVLKGQAVAFQDYVCFGYCEVGPCVEVNGRLLIEATAPKIVGELAKPLTEPKPSHQE